MCHRLQLVQMIQDLKCSLLCFRKGPRSQQSECSINRRLWRHLLIVRTLVHTTRLRECPCEEPCRSIARWGIMVDEHIPAAMFVLVKGALAISPLSPTCMPATIKVDGEFLGDHANGFGDLEGLLANRNFKHVEAHISSAGNLSKLFCYGLCTTV